MRRMRGDVVREVVRRPMEVACTGELRKLRYPRWHPVLYLR